MTHSMNLVRALGIVATLGLTATATLAGVPNTTATATLKNLEGDQVGMAQITQSPHGVLVHIRVSDLPPGAKGVHFHRTAYCAAEDKFTTSNGHHGEGEGEHGLLNAGGPGMGDLGNIYVGEDGVGEMQFFKAGVFLDNRDLPLMDGDGTAIVIHANEDDQVTQPIGGAGPRIVCGLVKTN